MHAVLAVLLLGCTAPPDKKVIREVIEVQEPEVDLDGDGEPALEDGGWDCDDTDPAVHPQAPEVCNGIDDDCDTRIDDADTHVDLTTATPYWTVDADGDGYGVGDPEYRCEPPDGVALNGGDCDDADVVVNPSMAESCRAGDDDCDGLADEDDPDLPAAQLRPWYVDRDGDGWGDLDGEVIDACAPPEGYAVLAGDCDDTADTISPDGVDACTDGVDQDCDGHEPNAFGVRVTNDSVSPFVVLDEVPDGRSWTIDAWIQVLDPVAPAPIVSWGHAELFYRGLWMEFQYDTGFIERDDAYMPRLRGGPLVHVALSWNQDRRVMEGWLGGELRLSEAGGDLEPLPEVIFFGQASIVEVPQDILITQARLRVDFTPADGDVPEPYLSATPETWGVWHIERGEGSVVGDDSGNGRHLVVAEASWVDGPECPDESFTD